MKNTITIKIKSVDLTFWWSNFENIKVNRGAFIIQNEIKIFFKIKDRSITLTIDAEGQCDSSIMQDFMAYVLSVTDTYSIPEYLLKKAAQNIYLCVLRNKNSKYFEKKISSEIQQIILNLKPYCAVSMPSERRRHYYLEGIDTIRLEEAISSIKANLTKHHNHNMAAHA